MNKTKFWVDTLERMVRTAAQAFIASIGTTALIQEVQWDIVGGTTALATVLSFATALAAPDKAVSGNASFRQDA